MKNFIIIVPGLFALILSALPVACRSQLMCNKTDDLVVDPSALTINGRFGQSINGQAFQQDALITHLDFQYVGYYDGKRQVCLARRKLPAGDWEIIRFRDYQIQNDDAHNTISIGICPGDGTIHMAFDHHVDTLRYRVSRQDVATRPDAFEWDESLFSEISSRLTQYPIETILGVTYPRFFQTPAGGLQFQYRRASSGNGDNMLVGYNPETGTWSFPWQIDSREGRFKDEFDESFRRNAYPNGFDYGPHGKLHTTWVWREWTQGPNHDLMYAYSEDGGRTWLNNAGQALMVPPNVESPGIIVAEIGRGYGLMNNQGQAVDSEGRIHVVMWHCTDASLKEAGSKPGEYTWGPPEARRYHHYWCDTNGKWERRELPWIAGNRPKLFIDSNNNAILIYGAKQKSSKMNYGIYFASGDLVIAAATAASKWTDWKVIHTEDGPFGNEMLGDTYRWKSEGILSVMVQETPPEPGVSTALRILDFSFEYKNALQFE